MGKKSKANAIDAVVGAREHANKVVQQTNKTHEEPAHNILKSSNTHKDAMYYKDIGIKLAVLISSIYVVQYTPVSSPTDVHKSPSSSFFAQYFAGKLNVVPNVTQMLIAAAASVFFDFFVVYYHLSVPPHPKFVLVTKRKISILTHLFSGITEIVSGVVAFTVTNQTVQQAAATILALASITHSLTAYYQTGIVFGAKGIMTPGYIYAITIHITFAFRLFFNPTSFLFLITTFLMLHIYVWCRFFVFFFRMFSAFNGYHYTIAITLSGSLLFPYALGPIGNYAFLLIAAEYCILEALLSGKKGKDLSRMLFAEHERYALITEDAVEQWKDKLAHTRLANPDEKVAKEIFDSYDADGTGKLGVHEVQNMLSSLGDNLTVSKVMEMADIDRSGNISFEEFYRFIWNAGVHHLEKRPNSQEPQSEEKQARLVFEMLDADRSGYIDLVELEMLLTQWGMPEGEAEAFLATQVDKKQISFESFYHNLKPIWSFAITQVFDS